MSFVRTDDFFFCFILEPFCLASYTSAFHAVMFNPVESRILTTANSKEGVGLWDVRKPLQ
jgi:WD repeat-containing protein 22